MDSATLHKAGLRWLKSGWKNGAENGHGRCSIIAEDKASLSGERPDLIGWYDKKSILIEVKVSRADFFRDGSKSWRMYGEGMGQVRWYLTPPSMVRWDEVPYSYGLAESDGGEVTVVLEPLFRGNIYDLDAERSLLMSLLRAKSPVQESTK